MELFKNNLRISKLLLDKDCLSKYKMQIYFHVLREKNM